MKSKIQTLIDYKTIPIPLSLMQIEIPSWQAVAQPLVDQALKQYEELTGEFANHLTDEMIQLLNLPNIHSVHQLKSYGMDLFSRTQTEYRFYRDVLPFVINYYAEYSNAVLNSDEIDIYTENYIQRVEDIATDLGYSLDDYVYEVMELDGDAIDALVERAREDFIFKLVAHQIFAASGGQLNEDDYEAFIQHNVIHNQADAIALRSELTYEQFKDNYAEMLLVEDIYNYFAQEVEFIINPNASLSSSDFD